MDYEIDLDPTHSAIRLRISAEIVTIMLAEEIYVRLSRFTSSGIGLYAAIYDLSAVRDTTIPTDMVRSFSKRPPSVPTGRPQVVVGQEPVIFGLARLFQMCREDIHGTIEVVHSLKEAYEIVGVRPEDFTEHLFPANLAA